MPHLQTALHLSARRGCLPMLTLLLGALASGGPRFLAALQRRDASGDTPASAARKYCHAEAEAEVLRQLRRVSVRG